NQSGRQHQVNERINVLTKGRYIGWKPGHAVPPVSLWHMLDGRWRSVASPSTNLRRFERKVDLLCVFGGDRDLHRLGAVLFMNGFKCVIARRQTFDAEGAVSAADREERIV